MPSSFKRESRAGESPSGAYAPPRLSAAPTSTMCIPYRAWSRGSFAARISQNRRPRFPRPTRRARTVLICPILPEKPAFPAISFDTVGSAWIVKAQKPVTYTTGMFLCQVGRRKGAGDAKAEKPLRFRSGSNVLRRVAARPAGVWPGKRASFGEPGWVRALRTIPAYPA